MYFLVTIILNLTVFFGTWYVWRKKELEIMASFNSADKESEAPTAETSGRRFDWETAMYVQEEMGHAPPGLSRSRSRNLINPASDKHVMLKQRQTHSKNEGNSEHLLPDKD